MPKICKIFYNNKTQIIGILLIVILAADAACQRKPEDAGATSVAFVSKSNYYISIK